MTERNTLKIKRAEAIKSARKPAADGTVRSENGPLRAALAVAQQRIAELEQRTADALDRIAWAVDSLHNCAEDE